MCPGRMGAGRTERGDLRGQEGRATSISATCRVQVVGPGQPALRLLTPFLLSVPRNPARGEMRVGSALRRPRGVRLSPQGAGRIIGHGE